MAQRNIRALRIGYDLKDPPTRERALAEIKEALTESHGKLVEAAATLTVSFRVLVDWIAAFPELRAHVDTLWERYGRPNKWDDGARVPKSSKSAT